MDSNFTKTNDTLTAAWCSVKQCVGLLISPLDCRLMFQMASTLSLPPLANVVSFGDHSNPHTSWVWYISEAMWCLGTLTSCWWIAPVRDPLQRKSKNRISQYQLKIVEVWLKTLSVCVHYTKDALYKLLDMIFPSIMTSLKVHLLFFLKKTLICFIYVEKTELKYLFRFPEFLSLQPGNSTQILWHGLVVLIIRESGTSRAVTITQ